MAIEHTMERDDTPFTMEELQTAQELGQELAMHLMQEGEQLDLRPAVLGAALMGAHINLFLNHGMGDPATMMDQYKKSFVQIVTATRARMKQEGN
jgi:hypothetical protein